MKKHLFILLAFVVSGLFTACEKEDINNLDNTEEAETLAQDAGAIQDLMEALDDEIDIALEGFADSEVSDRSACPAIAATHPRGTYPNVITLTFADGCTTRNGRTIKGKIIIEISDTMSIPGAVKTVTLEDFYVEGAKFEATRIFKNIGSDDQGNPCFSRQTTLSITFPNGSTSAFNGSHTVCKIAGADTRHTMDDIFKITGQSSGTTRAGNTFTSTIAEALIKPRNCHFITKGLVVINRSDIVVSLNFGNGFCDRFATLTRPDGTTRRVTLDPWWKR